MPLSLSEDLRSTNRSEQWTVTSRSISLSFPNFNFASTQREQSGRGGITRTKQYIFKLYSDYCIWIKQQNLFPIVRKCQRNIDNLLLAAFTGDHVFPSKTKDLQHLGVGVYWLWDLWCLMPALTAIVLFTSPSTVKNEGLMSRSLDF